MGDVTKPATVLHSDGASRTIGPYDPHRDLLVHIGEYAERMSALERKQLQRLAWYLGINGHQDACEAIMEHAKEPTPYSGYGMYGHYGAGP